MELKATRYEIDEGVAVVTLARPKRRNAWTGRMHTEYRWILREADNDPAVRVIVVTGDPEGQAFCAGADLGALEATRKKAATIPGTDDSMADPGFGVDPAFDASFAYHFGIGKPVIAAINGAAAGVGLVLAAFADLRFAAESQFTAAHGRFNSRPSSAFPGVLPRIVGLTHANDILLSSRVFTAGGHGHGLPEPAAARRPPDGRGDGLRRTLARSVAPGSARETSGRSTATCTATPPPRCGRPKGCWRDGPRARLQGHQGLDGKAAGGLGRGSANPAAGITANSRAHDTSICKVSCMNVKRIAPREDELAKWATQLRKGGLGLAALATLWNGRLDGLEMLRRLEAEGGLRVPEGTIYPLLSRLKAEGHVTAEWVEAEAGHPRKYDALTERGRARVRDMAAAWTGFARGAEPAACPARRRPPMTRDAAMAHLETYLAQVRRYLKGGSRKPKSARCCWNCAPTCWIGSRAIRCPLPLRRRWPRSAVHAMWRGSMSPSGWRR